MCHCVCLKTQIVNTKLLALDVRGPCSAKWIEDKMNTWLGTEFLYICSNQVGGKAQNKLIPRMKRLIMCLSLIIIFYSIVLQCGLRAIATHDE